MLRWKVKRRVNGAQGRQDTCLPQIPVTRCGESLVVINFVPTNEHCSKNVPYKVTILPVVHADRLILTRLHECSISSSVVGMTSSYLYVFGLSLYAFLTATVEALTYIKVVLVRACGAECGY